MTQPQIMSLCSGYGGLDMAAEAVTGGVTVAFAEYDDDPARILAHHWPDVPNLRDVTAIDWQEWVGKVDVLTGGFPCQDVSTAGKRAGLRPGTRTGIWTNIAYGISVIRPSLVLLENVGGLLSAGAHSDVEPCPWCMGDVSGEHVLRALGAVLGDLASLGYDAQWTRLRAADVGAPHGRARVFIAARPVGDTACGFIEDQRVGSHPAGQHEWPIIGAEHRTRARRTAEGVPQLGRPAPVVAATIVADADDVERDRGWGTRGRRGEPTDRHRPAADADGQRHGGGQDSRGVGRLDREDAGEARERERSRPESGDRSLRLRWGAYEPAIRRWERTLGRSAPRPTDPGRNGRERLSPRFVEWLMGLPEGHVTAVPGLSRNAQLKALGNGVVPQQAVAAYRMLLPALYSREVVA